MRVSMQPAFILHSRPYRDTSLLLEALTAEYGRLSLVARGARRRARGGSANALLQPFTPLLLSYSGRSDLKTLTGTETAGGAPKLHGKRLFSGLYLNELLMRLLHRHDAHPRLFVAYAQALTGLERTVATEGVLRRFELALLEELGYAFDFGIDAYSGDPVAPGELYHYEPGCGMVPAGVAENSPRRGYSGAELLAMAAGELGGPTRSACKNLLREVLAAHLGARTLHSRELFSVSQPRPAGRDPDLSSI